MPKQNNDIPMRSRVMFKRPDCLSRWIMEGFFCRTIGGLLMLPAQWPRCYKTTKWLNMNSPYAMRGKVKIAIQPWKGWTWTRYAEVQPLQGLKNATPFTPHFIRGYSSSTLSGFKKRDILYPAFHTGLLKFNPFRVLKNLTSMTLWKSGWPEYTKPLTLCKSKQKGCY